MFEVKIRIAVFVSGGGTNLQALIDAQNRGKLKHGEVVLVVSSNPEAYALQRAEEAVIPSVVVSKKDFSSQEAYEAKLIEVIEENKIDLIVLAGYMSILSAGFTSRYPNRIINVHPSLIPAFCGKGYYGIKVHEEVLKYGCRVTGATVHYVNEVPDGGKILYQKAVDVDKYDTPESLQRRVMEEAEWKLIVKAAEKVSKRILRDRGYEK